MATTTRAPRRRTPLAINDEDLEQLMALSSGADSVELKLTVPDVDQRSAIEALGLDPLDAQIRLVCFFDTPELTLNKAGVIVRARRVQGRSCRTSCLRSCADLRACSSSSTRCPAATSAQRR
jgi:hypothetical protein